MITEYESLRWDVDEGSGDNLGPSHEDSLTPYVLSFLPDGGVFIDVGAHVGHYTARAAGQASKVVAVEPNPSARARLERNLELNQIANVRVVGTAAWDGVARFRVQQRHERDGSARMIPDPAGDIWGARLDDALSQYPLRCDRIDLVKLDVEGSDLRAIDGMRGLIGRHEPVLFVEDHSIYGLYDQGDLFALLDTLGYGREEVRWESAVYWLCRPASASASSSPG